MSTNKKILFAGLLCVLAIAILCAIAIGSNSRREHNRTIAEETSVPEQEPVIGMTVDALVTHGIEGSYCTTQLCVDKAGPSGFTNTVFTPIASNDIVISLREPANEVAIGLRNETGGLLTCHMQVKQQDATTYTATICNDPGQNYYVDVSAWWKNGGDATYYFPVTTKK